MATTVTLGSVPWPLLRKVGYPKESGGGVLAASGIGAILSPPTLGDAAFIIAFTGGDGFKTMMLTARYTLPAFLVPFAFTLSPNGEGLLLQGGLDTILLAAAVSAIAVGGLAVALGGWLRGPVAMPVRVLAGAGSILLLYLEPLWIGIGLAVLAVALAAHFVLSRGGTHPSGTNHGP